MNKFKPGDRVYIEAFETVDWISPTGTVIGKDETFYQVKMDWYESFGMSNELYQSDPELWHSVYKKDLRKLTKLEELLLTDDISS